MPIGRRVRGEGPTPNDAMVIGDWIGQDEARTGRPFSGKVGRELDRFFDSVILPPRHQVYVTTWIKEWCGPDDDYTAEDFARDLPDLLNEIKTARPTLIVSLGRNITRYVLGDVDMEEVHGIPWYLPPESPICGLFPGATEIVCVPVYSPGAGFKSPEIAATVAYDFTQLGAYWDGELAPKHLYDDQYPDPNYLELFLVEQLDRLLFQVTPQNPISVDTEGYPHAPWSAQLTFNPGESYVIRFSNTELITHFATWVNEYPELFYFIFHNALHDLSVFRAFGINTTILKYDDTMIMAYNLQLEPQGLKPLCVRWCGMRMDSYDSVMGDVANERARIWLFKALAQEDELHETRCIEEFYRLRETPYTDAKGKVKPGRKLKVIPKLAKSALHKSIERCARSPHPRKLWGDQIINRHVEARSEYGDVWEASLDHVPLERAIRYAGRDSDGTHRLYPQLLERIRANDLWDVYQADLGTVPLIDRMHHIGIRPDLRHFETLGVDLGKELLAIQGRLNSRLSDSRRDSTDDDESGAVFNPNSSDQVGRLLFTTFNVTSLKKTPGGDPSTNDKVLEALEKDANLPGYVREIVADIREYREIYKLKFTFVDQIPDFVNRWPFDGRIHATFRITRVVTGRLAASDPNLLAMPKHGKFATRFREGFVSGDGACLASWDLSQIELRVLAHLSQDPVLLNAFRTGLDLHAALAERIFGIPPRDQDDSKHRLPAKAVNFGIPMGMTNIGLCLELRKNGVDINEDDAQKWLDETAKLYVRVPEYQQYKIAEARRYGFVKDIRGRRRYVGGIHSWDRGTKSEAERFAFATPIQAGAQEIMKEAEAYVYHQVLIPHWKRGHKVEPIVQIHDDLVMETEHGIIQELNREMVHAMCEVPKRWLSVPIKTKGVYGTSWGNMEPILNNRAA